MGCAWYSVGRDTEPELIVDAPASPVRALVIASEPGERLVVGGIGLVERWRRSLAQHGVGAIEVTSVEELPARLASATTPVVVAWSDHVAEHLAIEAFAETAAECEPDTLRTLSVEGQSGIAPIVTLGVEVAHRAAELPREAFADADALLAAVGKAGMGKTSQRTVLEGYWSEVRDEASARRATWRLIDRLRWRPGGLVAKHLNRPISTRLSYLLVNTRVTPNQTTIAAFLIGAVGVVYIFMGGYWNTVIGTALLQVNSIVDGIDGELARVRHETSEFGAYLDSVCDEILNSAAMIGIGYELTRHVHGGHPLYLALGTFAGVMSFVYALVHWHCKVKHGLGFYWWFEAYKPRREVQRSTSVFNYLKKMTMKEGFLFLFLVAAIFNVLEVMVWLLAIAGAGALVLFIIHIPIKRARW